MKLYVLPVELRCQGSCASCITKFRGIKNIPDLNVKNLETVLKKLSEIESIEITGGGEPTLHESIVDIIDICSRVAPTQMYTHGMNVDSSHFSKVSKLCLSRWHYDDRKNEGLMGVQYDIQNFVKKSSVPVKLSVVAQRGGISTMNNVFEYVEFAQSLGVQEVVVRQLFEHKSSGKYDILYSRRFVSTNILADECLKSGMSLLCTTTQGNSVLLMNDISVEFEFRSCACETNNPVLHADGRLTKGWTEEQYDFNGERDS